MTRLLGRIEVYGTKASLDNFVSLAPMPNWELAQIGLKKKIPELDAWTYSSPFYRFDVQTSDEDIYDFIAAHGKIGDALKERYSDIEYAFFTLVPVIESYEDSFAGIFSCKTLALLSNMRLELQISPEATMPAAEWWSSR